MAEALTAEQIEQLEARAREIMATSGIGEGDALERAAFELGYVTTDIVDE